MSLFPLRRGRGHLRARRRVVVGAERLERRLAMSASNGTTPTGWTIPDTAGAVKARAVAAPAAVQPVDAPRWVVHLAPGADAAASAAAAGAAVSTPTGLIPDTFIWEFPQPVAADFGRRVAAAARELPADVVSAYPLVARQQSKKLVPNDPQFANQWHLRNTGQGGGTAGQDANVTGVWDQYQGSGVVIGIVDDGLQHAHADLAPNYVAAFSRDFNDNDADPTPLATDGHGTSAAGVAAARGDNGIGVSGSAPLASLAGLRLIAAATDDAQEATGLSWLPQDIDIYSNSWGPDDSGAQLAGPGPLTLAALEQGVTTGRNGLGSIYVWAAGNGLQANDNVNYDGYANSRFTIAVTAITNTGVQADYAEPGAAILVAAPSSGGTRDITTTDLIGTSGYNTSTSANGGDYTDTFGGTSSATPLVSGVVALMLEANPDLTWRDVQHVLVDSARRNDPTDADWAQNGAGRWVNHKYGFGAVDAAAAVGLAESWTSVGPEVKVSSGTQVVGLGIPDNNTVGVTSSYIVTSGISTEWVEVTFAATHTYRGDLEVVLTSPSGTSSVLAEKHDDANADYTNWKFTSARNWGETSVGTWTLTVKDLGAADVGTWTSWSLDVYGADVPPTIDIAGSAAEPLAIGQSSIITFTLSEGSTDFTDADLTVTGGTLTPLAGSGTTYTATFVPDASFTGNAVISVAAGSFTDVNGNANETGASLTIAVDTVAPTVAIARSGAGTLTVGASETITFTLSEASTSFTREDVTVTGGVLSALGGTGPVYTATFTPAADFRGTASISVAAGVFTDIAGNPNLAGGPLTLDVDTIAPTVTIARAGTGTLKGGDTDTLTFTLSEAATDFTDTDITVVGGSLSGFIAVVPGTSYSATFTPSSTFNGLATVSIAAGSFTNASGNGNAGASLEIPVDTAPPTVAITRAGTGPLRIGTTDTVTFTLSEPSSDFAIGNVTVSGGTLSLLSASGLVYTATFTPAASFEGTASISVQAGTFTDGVGYGNLASGPLSIPVDTVAPTVAIARSGTGTLKIGSVDTITFTLSESSTDFTITAVTVVGGTLDAFAGSGVTYSATFTPDKNFTGTATISVAAAAFTDLAQNANLAGGPLGIPVDTAAPSIVGFSSPTPFTTVGIGGTVVIVADFSEPVTIGGVVTVQLNSGASLQLVVDSTGLVASGTYVVQPGEVADDLDVVAIVPDGSIADAVGNALVDTPPASGLGLADQCGIVVDGAVKVVDSGDFSTNPALVWDVKSRFRQIPIRFSTPVTGVTVRSFVVYQNDVPIPMRGAKVSGTGLQYTLSLPISRARPVGLYRLDIAPDSGIQATANGAAASSVSSIRWGNGRSIGVLPDAPAALEVTPSAPSRRTYAATLSWTTPAGNAGGAVIDYTVEYRAVGSATWLRVRRAFPAATTSATIQGLAAGKAYEFRITARNAFGLGASALGVTPLAGRARRR